MVTKVETAAVLGSGVMGMGIAAHLANAGVRVHLLDIVPKEADGSLPEARGARDRLASAAIKGALKHKPKPFMAPHRAAMITPGNLTDHLDRLADVDWVIEAVIEHPGIKRSLYAKVAEHLAPNALLTSNTSGIPLTELTQDMDAELKKRFFITHFFNPARYMRLLEFVPGPESDMDRVQGLADFARTRLGKGVVWAKDTPSFIANRIGVFGMCVALHLLEEGYSTAEIDAIAGAPTGRPKSAAFRTADVVGLDTLVHVIDHCYANLTEDPARDTFKLPGFLRTMIENRWLGAKTKQGFYKKTKIDGKKTILALDVNTMEYAPSAKVRFGSTGAVRNIADPGKRIATMLAADDRGGEIARKLVLPSLAYAVERIPEIADRIEDVDRALRWGFNWDLGPFEVIDAIGLETTINLLKDAQIAVPQLLQDIQANGGTIYSTDHLDGAKVYNPAQGDLAQLGAESAQSLPLANIRRGDGVVLRDSSATLLDLGDGVFGLEFRSKMNAIDESIIKMLGTAVDRATQEGLGLVITNEADNFSVGANLLLIGMAAKQGKWEDLRKIASDFQNANRMLRRAPVPVVAAPFGLTLGGGLEVCLGADAVQAHIETYHGLVEVGVGIIPAGGGTKEVLVRLLEDLPATADPFPYVQTAFESIGMAKVAESAEEGRALGYMRRSDGITMNRLDLTAHAKARVIGLSRGGYAPPQDPAVRLPGSEGIGNLTVALQGMLWNGFISEHDLLIGKRLATVLCGGEVPSGTLVTEQRLLELEVEAFLSLAGEEKSLARIEHMLMTGKPLRN